VFGQGMLWNWNLLGAGQHTVRVLADGVEFDSATFEVNTLGEEFVTGLDLRTEPTALNNRLTWLFADPAFRRYGPVV
jgi:hypothetical protein